MKRLFATFGFLLAAIGSFAQVSIWNGDNFKWIKGDGSIDTPYLIESAEHLAYLAECTSGGVSTFSGQYFKLVNDINLNDLDWRPIGRFCGIFDGSNHEILGLNNSLFSTIENATIKNIRVNANIQKSIGKYSDHISSGLLGVICCYSNNSTIEHCLTKGSIQFSTTEDVFYHVAGICAMGDGSEKKLKTIRQCINEVNISTDKAHGNVSVAGIATSFWGDIISCANKGVLKVDVSYLNGRSSSARVYAIGMFGGNGGKCKYCYNVGELTAKVPTPSIPFIYFCTGPSRGATSSYATFGEPFGNSSESGINCYSLSSTNGIHTKTESAMKGAAFPEILNQGENVFIQDITPNINNGFPIFAYQITEKPTYERITEGESYRFGDNEYTESGEYYYYEPDDWGAIKHVLHLEVEPKHTDDVVLIDGETYSNDYNSEVSSISYTRNFSDTEWQALYIPFQMSYEDWVDEFEVAKINMFHQYDIDDDGSFDNMELEIVKVKSGTLNANHPYLIKALTPGKKTITIENATLYAAEENSFVCNSMETAYTFTGAYAGINCSEIYDNHYYSMESGSLVYAEEPADGISPYRWYLKVADREGHIITAPTNIRVMEWDGQTSGMCQLSLTNEPIRTISLDGRNIKQRKSRGLYIANGNKILIH